MNNQKLLIYDFNQLYNLLNELKKDLNLEIIAISKNKFKELSLLKEKDYLIVSRYKIPNIKEQFLINNFPIKISKLVEKFNIEFLKKNFNEQSEIILGNYIINLNSRELTINKKKIKLTEKESNIIIYLSKFNKPIKIDELQLNVWGYKSHLETHTVETHIYRLRKKILNKFNLKNFIISEQEGYKLNF